MERIADDPIVRCMERSGYPPWMRGAGHYEERAEDARGEDEDGRQE